MATKKVPARTKRAIQPQSATQIDWGNPLTKGLVLCTHAGVNFFELTTRTPSTITGAAQAIAPDGKALSNANSTFAIGTQVSANFGNAVTCVAGIFVVSAGGGALGKLLIKHDALGTIEQYYTNTATQLSMTRADTGGNPQVVTLTIPNNTYIVTAVTIPSFPNTTGSAVYLNGVPKTPVFTQNATTTLATNTAKYDIGNRTLDYTRNFDGKIEFVYRWNRALTPAEVASISANPYQIFKQSPAKSSLWLNATAASADPAFQADAFQNDAFQTAAGVGIVGTLAVTLDDVTVSSSATAGHSATLAATLDSVAFDASATKNNGISAVLAITLDGVTVSSSATVGHSSTLAITLDSVTVAFVATAGHSATLAVTLDSVAFDATATKNNGIAADLAITLDSVAISSNATAGHPATLTATLDTIDVVFAATAGHLATFAATLDGINFAASATQANGLTATLAVTLDDISFNSAIVLGHSATIAFTLDDVNVAITAVNSNGPPVTGYVETLIVLRTFTDRKRC